MALESAFQLKFTKRLRKLYRGCFIIKQDTSYQQGIPDWLMIYHDRWAMFEIKREFPTSEDAFEPNQLWYIDYFDSLSFCACVYPENEEEVIRELQQALPIVRHARVS